MQVVILCGGQGIRLREETEYRPKPMGKFSPDWHTLHHAASALGGEAPDLADRGMN